MTVLTLTALIFVGSLAAGLLGSLTGLGGGVVIVPLLTIGFGVDLRYAIGASLVSVIATSSAAAAAYVKEGYTNLRVGMFLESATTLGAIGGATVAAYLPAHAIEFVFGVVLIVSAILSMQRHPATVAEAPPDRLAAWLRLDSSYPTPEGPMAYRVRNVPGGYAIMFVAGGLSGLLGIGSGALKVLAMDRGMKLPFKVSTTTSNFMIGVTAAAGAGPYLARGYVDPGLSLAVMLGVLIGATIGTRILMGTRPKLLRILFAIVLVALGVQMIYEGLQGAMGND